MVCYIGYNNTIAGQMVLRSVHLYYRSYNQDDAQNTQLSSRILFLLVSYLFLLVFIYFFIKKCIQHQQAKYQLDILPSYDVMMYLYGGVVLLMGAIGLFCAIQDSWTTHAWIYYFLSNLLIAIVIYVYQTDGRYTVINACLFAIVLSIMLQFLFVESVQMQKGKQRLVIRNLIGAVQAWSMVSSVTALGQLSVYDLSMPRQCQSILFFIFTLVITIIVSVWNRQEGYGRWNKHYGFCITASLMMLISMMRVCDKDDEHS